VIVERGFYFSIRAVAWVIPVVNFYDTKYLDIWDGLIVIIIHNS